MPVDNDTCFACGSRNPHGLQLQFSYPADGATAEAVFIPEPRYQGWQDIVHGGILMTLLDEVMAKAAVHSGHQVLTGEMLVRFRRPARILEPLRCSGRIESVTRKIVYAAGRIVNERDETVATATSKMMLTDQ
jgi:uncharacterized protein (TIGR00369 family)